VENVRVQSLERVEEKRSSLEGIGVIRATVIGVAVFGLLSVPLLLNIQTLKYNSEITNMTYETQKMNSQITDQKTLMNIFLQNNFPTSITFNENGQTFFVRSTNPDIKGDAQLAAKLAGQ
jgi:hypothetical protein